MYRGDSLILDIQVTDQNTGAPVNLTGAKVWFTAKRHPRDSDAQAVIAKWGSEGGAQNGVSFPDPVNGKATITILPSDTTPLPDADDTLYYDIQVKESSGVVSTVEWGKLKVLVDITESSL